jgi:hypothetical protein
METSGTQYRVIIKGRGHGRCPLYAGDSLYVAARKAREEAAKGKLVYLRSTDKDFRTRLYKPELASNQRWWYSLFCPKCEREMAADCRSLTCRRCWDPRNSQAHMNAVAAMNDRKRTRA